ncbi:MAG TPA: alpha/beta hydrolase [Burkholderiales bacterium]|jgi:arylformamidase
MKVFRDYDQAALDAQYNQRAWVPHADQLIARMAAASDAARKRLGEPRSERYGASEQETLDIYGEGEKAFVFVHGGAWQRESRRGSAYGAPPIVAAGATFVALGFAAVPRVTLPEMAAQVQRGLEWVHRNLSKEIFLFGHSSGAHLSAVALTKLSLIKKAVLLSGIYDLQPVRLSARNAYLKLDERLEDELSPLRHAGRIHCPVTIGWAGKDSDEFRRQSGELGSALKDRLSAKFEVPGLNHFEIVETLGDPASPVCRAALNMLA